MSNHPVLSFICRLPGRILPGVGLLLLAAPLHAMQLSLSVADVAAPGLAARGVRAVLTADGGAELSLDELRWSEKTWRKVRVRCAEFSLGTARVACRRGRLDAAPELSIDFSYSFGAQRLELRLSAAAGELWQVSADFRARPWHAEARLRNAQCARLAAFMPPAWPLPGQGALNGELKAQGDDAGLNRVDADVQLAGVGFADAGGLHAAEKLAGRFSLAAVRTGKQWDWHGALAWQDGELFWQPLYLRGGHTLQASGRWDGALLRVTQAQLDLAGVGRVEMSALWDMNQSVLQEGALRGSSLELKRLFSDFARPLLGEGLLAASELSGRGDVEWQYRDGATQALTASLRDAELTDDRKRFTLRGLNVHVPWRADAPAQAELSFREARLWGAPVGEAAVQVAMRGLDFSAAHITLPVFDGQLDVQNLHLYRQGGEWQWDFSSTLSPVSMQQLSGALRWPEMHGALSGMVPKVSYRDRTLTVEGALLFRVFDGTVVASRIELSDPFGRMPRLAGNLDMRGLDLDLLTRTFSFGNMQGRIDVSVNGLELVNWQPVRFDARLASSAGDYRRKISQKAVQNISALGGAGGAAALQRSYLRIFENFGYDRIGVSCVLRNDVCMMNGVGEVDGNSGAYAIVKGGGIPAINVIGYNRRVGWQELLTRLKRVMQDNVHAVVK